MQRAYHHLMREQHVTLGGRLVRYFDTEEGVPFLLIHAFPLSADLFSPQLAAPPPGWRLIAPDVRGFRGPGAAAPADPPVGQIGVDDYARDLIALLDHLRIPEAVVGGVSMGGYIAFALVRHAAHRVRGLVLADTRQTADTDEGRARRRDMLALIDREGAAGVADAMVPGLLGETTHRERPAIEARVRELILANGPDAIAAAVTAMMTRPDSSPLVPSIACPTLVVVGDEDTLTPVDAAQAMHEAIPGSRLVVLPGVGHLANLEDPDAFNASLARFLKDRIGPAATA
jgi:pimeloyl-ACP methyl ester carboxylesterase